MTAAEIVARISNGAPVRKAGAGYSLCCPAHDDHNPSLSVAEGRHGGVVLTCHAGCSFDAVLAASNLTREDLAPTREQTGDDDWTPVGPAVARYPYTDREGKLLFEVLRTADKQFRLRRPDPERQGRWLWKLGDVARVPYRLPQLIEGINGGELVVVVEGERDVERLCSLGFVATTNAMGAEAKWPAEWAPMFEGARVAIIPDNDKPGRTHARQVAACVAAVAAEVKVVVLPGLAEHGDVSDFLDKGGTAGELKRLIAAAAVWVATKPPETVVAQRPRRRPVSVCLADVKPEKVSWLWSDRIPLGKLTVLDGDPDKGKSTITLDLAARVTTGSPMPDGSRSDLLGPAAVVMLSAEDGAGDTIRPRADSARADVQRIHLLTDAEVTDDAGATKRFPWLLPRDLDVLRHEIESKGARLVVIDPLNAFLEGRIDSHRDQDVRGALRPLADLADVTGAAVLVVRHLSKSGGTNALYRGGGSIGIIGAARSGLLVACDPDDESGRRKVLARSKGNLAPEPPALQYELVPDEEHGSVRIRWLGESAHTAAELLAEPAGDQNRSKLEEAIEIMRDLLASGPLPAREVKSALKNAGVSERTADRAKGALRVRSVKIGRVRWTWALPPEGAQGADSEECHSPVNDTGDILGILQPEQDFHASQQGQSP